MSARSRLGVGVVGFGWMGQAHSRSMRRIPTLFAERCFDPELVVCCDTVVALDGRGLGQPGGVLSAHWHRRQQREADPDP